MPNLGVLFRHMDALDVPIERNMLLIADDDEAVLDGLYLSANIAGFDEKHLLRAERGRAALKIVEEMHARLLAIFTDGQMQDSVHGSVVAKKAVELGVPQVVILTATPGDVPSEVSSLPNVIVLQKPANPDFARILKQYAKHT